MNMLRMTLFSTILGLLGAGAWADTTSLPLTDDAWINANNPGANFGLEADMFVHSWGPKEGLVRFDAASISGQSVNSATLELYLTSLRESGDIRLYAITSSWNEVTVTWSNQPPAEAVPIAVVGLTTGDVRGAVAIDVTAAVQRWADGSLADAGFLIVTRDGIKGLFDAKEKAGGWPATLEVSTGPPEAKVERITVLDGSVVLGDSPLSTFWETDVYIGQDVLLGARSAHIGFYTIHNELGRLVINGEVLQLPYVGLDNQYGRWRPELGQTLLSIPLGYLNTGKNTIRFESGLGNWTTTNVYDNYEFGNVEIILSHR